MFSIIIRIFAAVCNESLRTLSWSVGEIDWIREQKQFAAENIRMEREYQELERELEIQEIQDAIDDINARAYRAYREEQSAYDDFLASLDMADK